ncbi:hypothetical protein Celaphus_00011785 [Cervus elaphus hippelaphus]|uniref:U3 small nucleolar RNA-associated protein 20 N-terminal domain-containing protein n=1 Tax=Cervus elaphus hippelaphus TaxID=46360 RepID=A0A212DEZ8_CEREH|nr:hypothetical protein Celaphus_00011785 [Cervus elaphus hippelaphus]
MGFHLSVVSVQVSLETDGEGYVQDIQVSDKNALFNLMFLDLDEHPEKVEGVGQLLFEMCKGVRNMFHSCTEKAIKLILQKLGPVTETEAQLPWILVGETLKNMVKSTALYIYKEHFGIFFECLQESLLDLHTKVTETNCGESSEQVKRLLETYLILVKHGNGSKITKPVDVCKVLSQTLQTAHLSTSCRETLLGVVSALILGENVSLPETLIRETIEKLFLPSFLLYIENCFLTKDAAVRDEALAILAKLILNKAAPPTAGSMAIEKYPLLFSQHTVGSHIRQKTTKSKGGKEQLSVLEHLLSIIQSPPNQDTTYLSCSWAALVVLPHVRPLEKEKVIPLVTYFIESLFMTVDRGSFGKGNLFVLCQAVNTLLSLEESSELLHLVPVERVKNLLLTFPLEPSVLLLADLYYQRLSLCGCRGPLSEEALMELFPKLQANISTGISKEDGLAERQSVFAILRQAELVPATVNDYREKLLHLRKLRHDVVQSAVPDGPLQEVPLRYLLGMLYVNFSALWDPVIELISSHAHEMENKQFWKVYYEHLEKAATHAERELQNDTRDEEKSIGDANWEQTQEGNIGALYHKQLTLKTDLQERLDHTNFRFLLWRALAKFPERVEPRSRELSPLFLRFINNEYYPADLQVAPTQDLRRKGRGLVVEEAEEETAARDDEELEEELGPQEEPSQKKKTRRAAAKYFCFLAKQKPGHPECDILTNVFAILSAKNLSEATASLVMEIADDLLSLPDFEPSEAVLSLPVTGCVYTESADESITIGGRLILPHVPAILQYLSKTTISAEKLKKKKNRAQVSKELGILSKISKFVKEKEQSSLLITLLLPSLCRGGVAQTLSDFKSGLTYITDVVKLSAFDQRHLDDINFDVRFSAFQSITSYIKEMQTVDINYLIPVMHNCFYNMEIHRRARALKKLAKQLVEGKVVLSSKSLQNYIMPYAMAPVFDEKMLKHENITIAATEVIGAVCKHLSWSAYVYYLKHFIHVLQAGQINQKLGVSLLVIVLEAFHFDHKTLEEQMRKLQNEEVVTSE